MVDIHRFKEIVLERMLEVADYQKEMCGKLENLNKRTQANGYAFSSHSDQSYMDMFAQDYLMIPLMNEFPNLVTLVEEDTGMRKKYLANKSEEVLIIDPIDGTSNYLLGGKNYAIMVGLLNRKKMVCGLACYPETKEVYGADSYTKAWKMDSNGKITELPKLDCSKSNSKIEAHYRFFREPNLDLVEKLKRRGYELEITEQGFGTNLTKVLKILSGEAKAFIGPHIDLHDIGVPAFIAERAGCAIKIFDYSGEMDIHSWKYTDNKFRGLCSKETTPRFRVIIADNKRTIEEIVNTMVS